MPGTTLFVPVLTSGTHWLYLGLLGKEDTTNTLRAATTFSLLDHATGSSLYTWLSMMQTSAPHLLEPSYLNACSQQHSVQHLLSSSEDNIYYFPRGDERKIQLTHILRRKKIAKKKAHLLYVLHIFKKVQNLLSNPSCQSPYFSHTMINTVMPIFPWHNLKKHSFFKKCKQISNYLLIQL